MDNDGLGTGPIIGIVFGVFVVLGSMIYCCFFRRGIAEQNTKDLMDQVNKLHAQEPHGEISPELLPDGTVGLTVRPLPAAPMLAQMGPNGVVVPVFPGVPTQQPQMSHHQQQPHYQQQHQQQQQLYMQGQHQSSTSPMSMAHSQQDLQQQLRLSTHPRPGVVTTVGGGEVKGEEEALWLPTPMVVPPTAPPGNSNYSSTLGAFSGSVFRVPGFGSEEDGLALETGSGSNYSSQPNLPASSQRHPQDHSSLGGTSPMSSSVGGSSTIGGGSGSVTSGTYSNNNSNNSHHYSNYNGSGGSGHGAGSSNNHSRGHYNELDFSQLIPKTVHNPHGSIPSQQQSMLYPS